MKKQPHTSILKASIIILLGGLVLAGCSNKSDMHQPAKIAPKTEQNVKISDNQSTITTPAKVSGPAYIGKTDVNKNGYRNEHLTAAEVSSQKKALSEIEKHHNAHGRKQLHLKKMPTEVNR